LILQRHGTGDAPSRLSLMSRRTLLSSIAALAWLLALHVNAAGADPATATESLRVTFA